MKEISIIICIKLEIVVLNYHTGWSNLQLTGWDCGYTRNCIWIRLPFNEGLKILQTLILNPHPTTHSPAIPPVKK